MLVILIRTISFIFASLSLALRMMGKRQVGERSRRRSTFAIMICRRCVYPDAEYRRTSY